MPVMMAIAIEGGGFYKFFKKYFVDQETIDLNDPVIFPENVSWPLPSFLVFYLRNTCCSVSG